ncbi:PQ-loop-domain-containing protein [Serendipita vermifera]|nr:PQ-loop-domain-containing protein [Serendipita vermifera]
MHPRDQASSALGWVSIACWILVYTPQIIENYQLKSGEGLSVLFILIWLAGDITNLLGAAIAGLIPTVIILAIYYTLCDIILLIQIYYYRLYPKYRNREVLVTSPDQIQAPVLPTPPIASEQTPLLPQPAKTTLSDPDPSNSTFFVPNWLRRSAQYLGGLSFVTLAGLTAWWIAGKQDGPGGGQDEVFDWTSQVLGWISAFLYIGSRIPQIAKNRETKCEGLSLALFLFAILGNVTYVLSICVISMKREHLLLSAPWLAGSIITIFLDFFVLGQFFYYRSEQGTLHLSDNTNTQEGVVERA